jgi:hypothetical protein
LRSGQLGQLVEMGAKFLCRKLGNRTGFGLRDDLDPGRGYLEILHGVGIREPFLRRGMGRSGCKQADRESG